MMRGDSVGNIEDYPSDKLTFRFSRGYPDPRTNTRITLGQCHLD